MTNNSLIDKVVMILNQSELYIGRLESESPSRLQTPYLLIQKHSDKMAIIPQTQEPLTLEGNVSLYNESNLGKKMRYFCYSPKDENVLVKMIDGIYNS